MSYWSFCKTVYEIPNIFFMNVHVQDFFGTNNSSVYIVPHSYWQFLDFFTEGKNKPTHPRYFTVIFLSKNKYQ